MKTDWARTIPKYQLKDARVMDMVASTDRNIELAVIPGLVAGLETAVLLWPITTSKNNSIWV